MKRFTYSTVGYGIFSLMGERYRMGRIEVHDTNSVDGYAVHEGFYCMPHDVAAKFEDFMDALETDLPIHFEIGSVDWCGQECAKSLGFENKEEMDDPEKSAEYRKKMRDEYARESGYKDWDDLMAKSKWTKKNDSDT